MSNEIPRTPYITFSEQAAKEGRASIEDTNAVWQQNIDLPLDIIQFRVAAINAKSATLREQPYYERNALPNVQVRPALNPLSQIDLKDAELPVVRLFKAGLSSEVGIFVEHGASGIEQQLIRGQLLLGPELFSALNHPNDITHVSALAISDLIETAAQRKTGGSYAYLLNGIEITNELGRSPSVIYHLTSLQKDSSVESITVERRTTVNGNGIGLFDRGTHIDTFEKYSGNNARRVHMSLEEETRVQAAQDILDAYEAIRKQGVAVSPDLRLISRAEGNRAVSNELTEFLRTLPFTNELTADFMAQEREQQGLVADEQAKQEELRKISDQEASTAREAQWAAEEAATKRTQAYLTEAKANASTVRHEDIRLEKAWEKALRKLPENAQKLLLERVTGIASRVVTFGRPAVEYEDDYFGIFSSKTRGFAEVDPTTGDIRYLAGASDDYPQGVMDLVRSNKTYLWNKSQFTSIQPREIVPGTQISATDNKNNASINFKPSAAIQLTERSEEGQNPEVTTIYFSQTDKNGIVMQCQSGSTTHITYGEMRTPGFYFAPGIKKPVIYLYPKKRTVATVTVKLTDAQFTNTYPQINGNTWNVVASPNGTVTVSGKKYKYLFWDGNPNREVEWDWSAGFSVQRDDVDAFLEQKVGEFGLNFAEAQDFITYWAPLMKQNKWNLVAFQTERYEELAQLLVDPKPDTLIRVYMVFKKIGGKLDIPEQKMKKMKRKGFTVVEWGGSNADELSRYKKI